MMAELLALTLLRTQAAAAAAVLLVLLLRGPTRMMFGARLAYRLWALVPVAAIATVFPSLSETLGSGAPASLMGEERAVLTLAGWLAGGVALGTAILLQERAFRARAEAGRAGPAVMGVFWPRVVLPADFALRFDEAMSAHNRWFCSEFHRREIHDLETLWNYYMGCSTSQRLDRPFRARSA